MMSSELFSENLDSVLQCDGVESSNDMKNDSISVLCVTCGEEAQDNAASKTSEYSPSLSSLQFGEGDVCDFCNILLTGGVDLASHLQDCPSFPVACPNGCPDCLLPQSEMKTHLLTCSRMKTQCPYFSVGCVVTCCGEMSASELRYHLASPSVMSQALQSALGRIVDLSGRLALAEETIASLSQTSSGGKRLRVKKATVL